MNTVMAEDLKNTGQGNLFVIFGEPDLDILGPDGASYTALPVGKESPKLPPGKQRMLRVINHLGDEVMKVFRV